MPPIHRHDAPDGAAAFGRRCLRARSVNRLHVGFAVVHAFGDALLATQ